MTNSDNENDPPAKLPGSSWRLLTHRDTEAISIENDGVLDELVLDDWFHLERMQENLWWMRVGDTRILVEIRAQGAVALKVERGFYGDINSFSDENPAS